jgi:hypothetical protein
LSPSYVAGNLTFILYVTRTATLDHLDEESAGRVLRECSESVGRVLEEWAKGARKVKPGEVPMISKISGSSLNISYEIIRRKQRAEGVISKAKCSLF